MKKHISILTILSMFLVGTIFIFNAKPIEAKSYGYKSSYKSYKLPSYRNYNYKSYKLPSYRNYNYGGQLRYQRGYYKPSSGKWIEGHFKTGPDNYKWNNRKNLYGW